MVGLALLFGAPAVYADDCCEPCNECELDPCDLLCNPCDINLCDYCYSGYVDFLYWKVNRSDLDYESAPVHYVCPDYEWGYRFGGRGYCGRLDLGFVYTTFNNDKSKDVESGDVKYKLDYELLDLQVGYSFPLDCKCSTAMFRLFAGAKLAWIDEKFNRHDDSDFNAKLEYFGYGLHLGVQAEWLLCKKLSFVTRASYAVLDGELEADVDDGSDERNDECLYVSEYNAFVGLDYDVCDYFCFDMTMQVGYEVTLYNGLRHFDDRDTLSNLGLGGLVIRLNGEF